MKLSASLPRLTIKPSGKAFDAYLKALTATPTQTLFFIGRRIILAEPAGLVVAGLCFFIFLLQHIVMPYVFQHGPAVQIVRADNKSLKQGKSPYESVGLSMRCQYKNN
jgi:hypothetical protein